VNYTLIGFAPDMARWMGVDRSTIVQTTNITFDIIFIVECFLKVLILGCFDKFLKKIYWKRKKVYFQIILALVCLLDLILTSSYPWIRIIRTAVIFRLVLESPQLLRMCNYLVNTIPALFQITILTFFTLLIFSIISVLLFNTIPDQRCRTTPAPTFLTSPQHWEVDPSSYTYFCGEKLCPAGTYCHSGWPYAKKGVVTYGDLNNEQLNYGATFFGDISDALFTNLLVIAGDDWSLI
jgi:hypothetical protein